MCCVKHTRGTNNDKERRARCMQSHSGEGQELADRVGRRGKAV